MDWIQTCEANNRVSINGIKGTPFIYLIYLIRAA
jgi:hypothetical protein